MRQWLILLMCSRQSRVHTSRGKLPIPCPTLELSARCALIRSRQIAISVVWRPIHLLSLPRKRGVRAHQKVFSRSSIDLPQRATRNLRTGPLTVLQAQAQVVASTSLSTSLRSSPSPCTMQTSHPPPPSSIAVSQAPGIGLLSWTSRKCSTSMDTNIYTYSRVTPLPSRSKHRLWRCRRQWRKSHPTLT